MSSQTTSLNITAILDTLERMLSQARAGRYSPELKRQILSLLSNLENAIRTAIDQRMMIKPTSQTINAVIQGLAPVFQAISAVRMYVNANNWEAALNSLYFIESEQGGEVIPGLREAILRGETALMLATQGFKEAAAVSPAIGVSPPPDLLFGAPAVIIPLYNILVREGRIEKEDAARRILPVGYGPEQRDEFERAWSILQAKGYARLEVDKRGRQYLLYLGG